MTLTDWLSIWNKLGIDPGKVFVKSVQINGCGNKVIVECLNENGWGNTAKVSPFTIIFSGCRDIKLELYPETEDDLRHEHLLYTSNIIDSNLGLGGYQEWATIVTNTLSISIKYQNLDAELLLSSNK